MDKVDMIISNFILWHTHKNEDEGHPLYKALDEYLENEDEEYLEDMNK